MPNNKKQQRNQQRQRQQVQVRRVTAAEVTEAVHAAVAAPDQGAILHIGGVGRHTGGREEFDTNDTARFLAEQEAHFAGEGVKLFMCRWIWARNGIGAHSMQDCRAGDGWNEYWKDEKKTLAEMMEKNMTANGAERVAAAGGRKAVVARLHKEYLRCVDAEHLGEKWFSLGIFRQNHPPNDPLSFMFGLVMRDAPRETYWFKSKKNRDALAAWLTA